MQTLSERPETYLSTYLSNRTLPLDRWGVQFNNIRNTVQLLPESNITSHPRKSIIGKVWKLATREGRRKKAGVLRAMNNYFGIGVDGAISMRFHEARNSMPYFFFSSIVNKFWYACVSLSTILSGKRLDLNSYIEIKCDGKRVQIPSNLQGIVLLNINSYAGGAKLWLPRNLTQWQPLNMSDGIVEVSISFT